MYSKQTIRARQLALALFLALTLSALVAPNGFDGRTLTAAVLAGYLIATTRTPEEIR